MSGRRLARGLVVILSMAALQAPAQAQAQALAQAPTPVSPPAAAASAAAAAAMADGEVRKIDKLAGKLTLRHGPIESLDMPGMTMVFRVSDPKMLSDLKVGDKLRFAADRVQGALRVTAIERAPTQ